MFMTPYLLMEASRLVVLSTVIAYFLLLLKENTMDIGLLIGASVAGGFLLLGMFYLWVCALNLPVLINEMKLDEQAATISKLQQLLEVNNQQGVNRDDLMEYGCGVVSNIPRSMFFVQRH
ncbi:unnamed protein product [Diatraea saccharalis]|uniref:Uncharacterized protein n=1 Tax=Diatraea saccharalis TaxID=40085 RepID=A0A9N9QUQ7_9NEOP|nr:unnamed protein product [Diatraea saccharalis]